ncbi:hypothetical protein EVAR_101415_1 [Eumeta japonica]|uniref:Uncharacterized protein n=1 Tax=Eumeta variegata TaxID=151549 RepID=A0A4C1SVN4_EUMVA|nr:hypothetical protein EVAR_101415_1 [Eumeta japonica]
MFFYISSHRSVLPEALQFLDKQPSRNRGGRYNRPVSRDRTRKSATAIHSFDTIRRSAREPAPLTAGSAAASSFQELVPSSEVVRPTRGTSYHRIYICERA